MGMLSKTRFPQRAKKDILCYKEFRVIENEDYLKTPIRGTIVPSESEWPTEMIPEHRPPLRFNSDSAYIKGEGYIHAFIYKHKSYIYPKIVLAECIIPKGTKYHISKSGMEICARKLILKRIIK